MISRTALFLGISAGLSAVLWGLPAWPLAPFWPELVTCYRRTAPEFTVKEVVPFIPLFRSDQDDIDVTKRRMEVFAAKALASVGACTPGACSAEAAHQFIENVRPYFVWRQRLTTSLFERRGEAALNITPLIFESDKASELKRTLKALVDSKTINLAAFRHERWIAALFVLKSDRDIRPCEYQGP